VPFAEALPLTPGRTRRFEVQHVRPTAHSSKRALAGSLPDNLAERTPFEPGIDMLKLLADQGR